VQLSVINGLSRLTKLTTSKRAGMADSIRKFGQSLSNRIELDSRFEFESNLEASQVPNLNVTAGSHKDSAQKSPRSPIKVIGQRSMQCKYLA